MNELEIKIYPEKVLREKSNEIRNIDGYIDSLTKDMLDTMYKAPGIGLAANQVGVALRIIVVDVAPREERGKSPLILLNPIIVEREGEIIWEEGCLSVPGMTAEVKRNQKVLVKGFDLNEKEITIEAEDLFAVVLQHEIDHLDGTLYFDRLSRLKREFFLKKYRKYLMENISQELSRKVR